MQFYLSYVDRRGAGVVRRIEAHKVEGILKGLRRLAILKTPTGDVVGGVEEIEGADDRRIRWNWWYDRERVK